MNPLILLTQCAPLIAPVTLAAVVQHESAGQPYAIHDNTTGRTLIFKTARAASAEASARIAQGHSLDLGLAQINSRNLPSLGVSVPQMFDPCENLRAAQSILLRAWRTAAGSLPSALSVYNTGRLNSPVGARYAQAVYAQARAAVPVAPTVPAIAGARMPPWTSRGAANAGQSAAPTSALAPVRPRLIASPQASGLAPATSGLRPTSRPDPD